MRKVPTMPTALIVVLVLAAILLAGCRPVAAPNGAVPAVDAATTSTPAAAPTVEAPAGSPAACTPGGVDCRAAARQHFVATLGDGRPPLL